MTRKKILILQLVMLLILSALAGIVISSSSLLSKYLPVLNRKDNENAARFENIVQNEDVLNACLSLAQDYYPDIDRTQANRDIEKIVDEIKIEIKDTSDPCQIVKIINEYLFGKLNIRSVGNVSISSLLPDRVLENKKGHCFGLSLLYISVAERLQLNIYAKIIPSHIYLFYDDGAKKFNIETVSGGLSLPDSHYSYYFPCPEDPPAKTYLRKLDKAELLGVFLSNLGSLLEKKKEALDAQEKALKLFPDFAEIHTNIGLLYYKLGDNRNAIKHLRAAVKLDPTLWQARSNLGNVYFGTGDYKKGVEENLKTIDLLFESAKIHANVIGLPENKNVIELAKEILQNKNASASEFIGLGVAVSREKEYQLAHELFERSLKYYPENPDIHSFQAIVNLHLHNYPDARKHAQFAEEKYGYSLTYGAVYFINKIADSYTELGKSYGMLKNYEASIDAFNKAVNIAGPNAEVYTALGTTYSLMKDKKNAVSFYKKALEIDPSYETAGRKLMDETQSK